MGDDQHRHPVVSQGAHDAQHLADQLRVQSGGRLVEEHQLRAHRQGAGDSHALLLTTGELHRVRVALIGQPDLFQQVHRVAGGGLLVFAVDQHRGLDDVLEHRAVGEEVEVLEDHPDAAALLGCRGFRDLV